MWDFAKHVEATLDDYGMPAWLAAMVLGFVLFAPIGLAVLGYMLWSGRMGCWGKSEKRRWRRRDLAGGETGNAAFDAYREATLRRLEDERQAFGEFLDRLRRAKDQAEFDQFMAERGQGGAQGGSAPQGPTGDAPGDAPSGPSAGPNPGPLGPTPQPAF